MKLTQAELEAAIRSITGQISLDKGAFVERSSNGRWFVGRNGLDLSEPNLLDKNGKWRDGGGDDCYLSTPLEALEHAKKHGYLPK